MAKLALNKSSLQKERERLHLLQRLLPSLDLKRRQLTLELSRANGRMAKTQADMEILETQTVNQIPMLANLDIDVEGLLTIRDVRLGEENVVGVKLPVLEDITFQKLEYSKLAKPHWVDLLVVRLKDMVTLRVRVEVAAERVRRLAAAVRRITQRVNLFDKILIPTTKGNIKKIQIFLGDAERAAVVRSKLAKAKHRRSAPEEIF